MDEARAVIQRLERIEALQRDEAPAAELLAEVRKLLRDGEAWLAAERGNGSAPGPGDVDEATDDAAVALAGCRASLAAREEVTAETLRTAPL